MSLITQAFLIEKYGPRLSIDDLASVLDMSKNTIYNQRAQGCFTIKTYVDGNKVFADYRDVAEYIDNCRTKAA